jgi:hypothetical protein
MKWSVSRPSIFTLGERASDTHLISGWVGAGLDDVERRKISFPYLDTNSDCTILTLYVLYDFK